MKKVVLQIVFVNLHFARIRTDSYISLPIEKILNFHNGIIPIKSVVNKDKNNYYYNIFLEKGLYKDKSYTEYFKINLSILLMLYFDRIDLSEGIDANKTSASKECDICCYWFFLNFNFKFPPIICNRCHELLMMAMSLSGITILKIRSGDYRCSISRISKIEAIELLQNINLTEKSGTV